MHPVKLDVLSLLCCHGAASPHCVRLIRLCPLAGTNGFYDPYGCGMQRVCVTRGVRVQAVAIFVPELSKQSSPQEPDPAYFFSYK